VQAFTTVDWHSIIVPSIGLAEIVLRGSMMYLSLFVILRFVARRQSGNFGTADLLVIVLIADAAQNALGKEYQSVSEGIALVLTIVAWEYLLDWLAWRFPRLRPLIKVPPLKLIEDGMILSHNLRKEMLSEDELRSGLRQQGVADIRDVAAAYIEESGKLSVIRRVNR
jgi:uncharacterized membrane protein YcaP (DUF421 family)